MTLTKLTRYFFATIARRIPRRWLSQRGSLFSQPQSRQPSVFKGGFRVATSTYKSLPVVYGTQRIAGNNLNFFDFAVVAHQSGGKGFGSGSYTNTYTEYILTGLCQGPITGVGRIWKGSGASTLLPPQTAALRYDFVKGDLGQVAENYIVTKHPGFQLGYSGIAYAWTKSPEDLGTSTQPPQFNWEVQGLFLSDAGSGADANPADIITDVLTNQQYGLGTTFQAAWLASLSNARSYWTANNLLLSMLLDQQKKVQEILKQIADITNGDYRWTYFQTIGYQLDFIPYGDQTVTNNGVTYIPNLTPTYCFTDNDFISGQGAAPIEITVKQPSDVNNRVGVEFLNRANNYDSETVYREEQDDIQNQGLRTAPIFQFHEIADPLVATNVAQMRLQREQTVINEYRFSVGFGYCLSDALDIVALCDSRLGLGDGASEIIGVGSDGGGSYVTLDPSNPLPSAPLSGATAGAYSNFTTVLAGSTTLKVYLTSTAGMQAGQWLGINPVSVRTTQITEHEKNLTLEFITEDLGVNTAQLYATQPRGPQTMGGGGSVPVSVNPPIIFEPTVPLAAVSHGQGELWFAVSGQNGNESWGGYYIYVSTDGMTFTLISGQSGNGNTPFGAATMGTLITSYPKTSDPYTGTTPLEVDLSESAGVINTISPYTHAKGGNNNLAYLDGEFVSFGTVAAGSFNNAFNITDVYRHLFGTSNTAHGADTNFVWLNQPTNIDSGIFRWLYPQKYVGQTLYFKFCSFNESLGEVQTPDSSVATYTYVIQGLGRKSSNLNALPDADLSAPSSSWPTGTLIFAQGAGLNAANAFTYTGSGSAAPGSTNRISSIVSVQANQTWCVAGNIDASQVTLGSPRLLVQDTAMSVIYCEADQTAGIAGLVQDYFDVPTTETTGSNSFGTGVTINVGSTAAVGNQPAFPAAGTVNIGGTLVTYTSITSTSFVGCTGGSGSIPSGTSVAITQVVIVKDMNGATVNSGEMVTFSAVQFQLGEDPTEYESLTAASYGTNTATLQSPVTAANGATQLIANIPIANGIVAGVPIMLVTDAQWNYGGGAAQVFITWRGHTSGQTYAQLPLINVTAGGQLSNSIAVFAPAVDESLDVYIQQNTGVSVNWEAGSEFGVIQLT